MVRRKNELEFSSFSDFPTTGSEGILYIATDTGVAYYWNGSSYSEITSTTAGDMTKATYDPTGVEGDAFDMDNMVEGTTNKILTDSERTEITDLDTKRNWNSIGAISKATLTDNLDGTIDIAGDGVYNYMTTADGIDGKVVRLYATTVATGLTLTDNTVNYVYTDYNAGSPSYAVTTNREIFLTDFTKIPVYRITREGTELHIVQYDEPGVLLANKLELKDIFVNEFQRQEGLVLSTAATRISTVSSGKVWFATELTSLDENIAGTTGELYEYYLVAGVWNSAVVTEYDSTYYSDGTDRQTLTTNRYVAKYFYRGVEDDNHCYYMHGNQYTSLSGALNEEVPTAPVVVTAHAIYVGKIVIQEGDTNGTAYPRAWDTAVLSSGVTNHNDLANIQLAGTGVTYGHISDQAETIYGDKTFNDNLTITGDLTVNGTTTTINTETVLVEDNILTLNNGETGSGVTAGSSGIEVDRGTATNYEFKFVESDDSFKVGETGSLQSVATREDTPTDTGLAIWDSSTTKFNTTLTPTLTSISTTNGATISKSGANLDAFLIKNSSYTHSFTDNADDGNTAMQFGSSVGGTYIAGLLQSFGNQANGLIISAYAQTPSTDGTNGALYLQGWTTDGGTGRQSLADSDDLFAIVNGNSGTKLQVKGNGQVFIGTTYTAPTDDNEVATKKYVDDNAGGGDLTVFSKANTWAFSSTYEAVSTSGDGPVVNFTDNTDVSMYGSIKVPKGATGISSAKVIYWNETSSATIVLRMTFEIFTPDDNQTIAQDGLGARNLTSGANVSSIYALSVESGNYDSLVIAEDKILTWKINREGNNASDTYSSDWEVYGVEIQFS